MWRFAAIRRIAAALPFLLAAATGTVAAEDAPIALGAPATDARLAVATHRIDRAASAVTVDGVLDETAWATALSLPLAYEIWPAESTPAGVATELLLTHDEHQLYVGFRVSDPEPAAIRAHLSDRDHAWDDDWVGVLIDTWNDQRRAFGFFLNPLGVQMDFIDQGKNSENRFNNEWDAIWTSRTRRTAGGWEAEMAIPFSQLQFSRQRGEQTWAVRGDRGYPRSIVRTFASAPEYRDLNCILCLFPKVRGLAGIVTGSDLELDPTLTGLRSDARRDGGEGGLREGDPEVELGLSARWQMTTDLSLGAALNPDFSQVEADVAQLDVNTRFSLFFPEKRVFFLEGADFVETPLAAVFTRTVADPIWGVKLTGKASERDALGVYVVEDEITNLILPANEQSSSLSLDAGYTGAAVRYRRDLGRRSNVGVLATSREGEDGYHNRVAGVDGLLRLGGRDLLRFQVLRSDTEYPEAVAAANLQPRGPFAGLGLFLDYRHEASRFNAWATYTDLDEDFRADSGFVPRVDLREVKAGGERVFWGREGSWYTRLAVGGEGLITEDHDGSRSDRETAVFAAVDGPWASNLQLRLARVENAFAGRLFDQDRQTLYASMRPSALWGGSITLERGDAIDFAHARPARLERIRPRTTFNLGRHLFVELDHTVERLEVEGGRLFTANLSQGRVVYHFSTRSFFRAVLQLTDVDRDPALFAEPVEARTRELFSQILFSYKVNPRTVLFLGYSDTRRDEEEVHLEQTNRTLFVKLGYAFQL